MNASRLLPLLALLAATAAPADVTVRVSGVTDDFFRLEVLGSSVPVEISVNTGQLIDQWKTPDLNGTAIATTPPLGGNNDGAQSRTITVTGPADGVAELDGSPSMFQGATIRLPSGGAVLQLVQAGSVWSATLPTTVTPPPPPPRPAKPVTLTWVPPTQNTDGTALTNLAGYKAYWGTAQGSYTNSAVLNSPALASYVVENLPANIQYFFVVTALNSSAVESQFSNVAAKITEPQSSQPVQPTGLTASGALRYAYTIVQTPNRVTLLPVGTIPDNGVACDGTMSVQDANRIAYRVPLEAVQWPTGIPDDQLVKPVVVFAECT